MNHRLRLSFFFAFVIFYSIALHTTATFNDPDSFYHARITELMIEKRGIITEFPWLPLTAFSQSFTDHHLLYHIFIAPFIALWGPVWGIKIATALSFVGLIGAFTIFLSYLVSARGNTKRQLLVLFFTASLFLNDVFILRMNLEKIPAASLLWLLGGTYALISGRRVLVFFFSFFFVWLHGAWPLMPLVALLYCLADRCSRRSIGICAVSIAGVCAGLVVNPYFPQNISFYLVQIFHVAVVTYENLFEVGSEWYPAGAHIIAWSTSAVILSAIATVVFFYKKPFAHGKPALAIRTTAERFFFYATVVFFILTLKSSRHGEYFAPFATIFACLVLLPFLETVSAKRIREIWVALYRSKRFSTLAIAAFLFVFAIVKPLSSAMIFLSFRAGMTVDAHKGSSRWLEQNTSRGSMVFNDQWGFFPSLWFWGGHNTYIAGLDPTFFYAKNPELFWQYEALRKGTVQSGVAHSIQKLFGANVVIVSKENSALRAVLNRDPDALLAYEDASGAIFTISEAKAQHP